MINGIGNCHCSLEPIHNFVIFNRQGLCELVEAQPSFCAKMAAKIQQECRITQSLLYM